MPVLLKKLQQEQDEVMAQKMSKLLVEHIKITPQGSEDFEKEMKSIKNALKIFSRKERGLSERISQILANDYNILIED